MIKKKNYNVNINFLLIVSIILVIVSFAFSNYAKLDIGKELLYEFDDKFANSEQIILEEIINKLDVDLSQMKQDVGSFGLNLLCFLFVWLPLIYSLILLLYVGIAWVVFRPTYQSVVAYRTLMTFAYLHIGLLVIILILGIVAVPFTLMQIKMGVFLLQCLLILIWNFYTTYSKKIYGNMKNKSYNHFYDENDVKKEW